MLTCTASTLRAILCYLDPTNTPKIAYDKDELALPLIDKIKDALGDKDGSQTVHINFSNFNNEERELERQFSMVSKNISDIFSFVHRATTVH